MSSCRAISPCGTELSDFVAMFAEKPPDDLTVLVMLGQPFRRTTTVQVLTSREPELRQLLGRPELDPSQFGLTSNVQFEFYDGPEMIGSKAFLIDLHFDWALDCGIVQVGFADTHKLGSAPAPIRGIFQSMGLLDALDFQPPRLDTFEIETYVACDECYAEIQKDIGDIYRQRIAVMNTALNAYRTAIAIAVRACLCGEDGVAAYANFKVRGGVHHLTYPYHCE